MIEKLPFLDKTNRNTPSTETSVNRSKINELVGRITYLEAILYGFFKTQQKFHKITLDGLEENDK